MSKCKTSVAVSDLPQAAKLERQLGLGPGRQAVGIIRDGRTSVRVRPIIHGNFEFLVKKSLIIIMYRF